MGIAKMSEEPKKIPCWHFWNPRSGFTGGLIGSIILWGGYFICRWLVN
jgi:hypothetical protein